MKKLHIVGILLIAVSVGVIISTIADSSTYSNFTEASQNPNTDFMVVGQLNLEKEMNYDPEVSPYFSFYLVDGHGKEEIVKFKGNKPQDFERSDQVVITGRYEEGAFVASKILMKCPSKYNNGNDIEVKSSDS
ncbi:MAG: cytochrome c maturation protein CcmE [Vicingaceae bacterium]